MKQPLSHAAQAVLDAAMQYEINPECYSREIAVAALRAVADEVASEKEPLFLALADRMRRDARNQFCANLRAIAVELEGANPDCGEEVSLHERFTEDRHD